MSPSSDLYEPAVRPGRLRAAWRAAHEPVPGVSRRIQLIAYAVPFTVLPAFLWRFPLLFDSSIVVGERIYILFMSLMSELIAFTAVGLIAPWGEVFPRWVPFLRGRPVPRMAAVIPAAIGSFVLTCLWTFLVLATQIMGTTIQGDELPGDFPSHGGGWEVAWFYVCYAPLTVWGPLLAVLTVAYAKRRGQG